MSSWKIVKNVQFNIIPYIVLYDPERLLHCNVPEHSIKFNFHSYLNTVKK